MPHLHFHEGDRPLFVHLLRPGAVVLVGRSDRCDVALPSDDVSRVHCTIERRQSGWVLRDRSTHGTQVNGTTVDERVLAHDDVLGIGPYRARFSEEDQRQVEAPTATRPLPAAIHEELVDVSDEGYAANRATLRRAEGGEAIVLTRARSSLGGAGSTVELSGDLPRNAAWIRVVRGRPMIEPGHAAVFLAGRRVREVTPMLPGEELRIGDHRLLLELDTVEVTHKKSTSFGEMVAQAPSMQRLFGVLIRVAVHDDTVLITGESGTGKELTARGIHAAGPRCEGPFVVINCAALPDNLFESELFGHEKGAFTGAERRQDGAFHRADGGTLFLDEIGELKPEMQAKLLRALESGEIRRVGGRDVAYPDVRIVAATNQNLPEMVRDGAFREDLYFRLAVLTVRLPSLAQRREDIPLIARTLMQRSHPEAVLTDAAIEALQQYDWPGNVREMRNVLTRAYVLSGSRIDAPDLVFNPWSFDGATASTDDKRVSDDAERVHLLRVLRDHDFNKSRAAAELGMARSTMLYKMRRLGIEVK